MLASMIPDIQKLFLVSKLLGAERIVSETISVVDIVVPEIMFWL